jgi:hypothetical protein
LLCGRVVTVVDIGLARVRNSTWPDWILAVPLSSVAREVVIAAAKPRFCGKVLVDTRIRPRVRLAGGTRATVQGDEVLDVGGDQRSPLGRRVCEDLVVGEPHEGWIGDHRGDVVALGAELLADVVGEHLVEQQRLAHRLSGQQLALV